MRSVFNKPFRLPVQLAINLNMKFTEFLKCDTFFLRVVGFWIGKDRVSIKMNPLSISAVICLIVVTVGQLLHGIHDTETNTFGKAISLAPTVVYGCVSVCFILTFIGKSSAFKRAYNELAGIFPVDSVQQEDFEVKKFHKQSFYFVRTVEILSWIEIVGIVIAVLWQSTAEHQNELYFGFDIENSMVLQLLSSSLVAINYVFMVAISAGTLLVTYKLLFLACMHFEWLRKAILTFNLESKLRHNRSLKRMRLLHLIRRHQTLIQLSWNLSSRIPSESFRNPFQNPQRH